MRRALALSAAFLALCVGYVAAADEFTIDGDLIKVTSLGFEVSLPVPAWGRTDGAPDAATLQLVRTPYAADIETLEFIPVGETIDNWTRMVAALVVAKPGYPAAAHEDSIASAFEKGCEKASLNMGVAAKGDGDLPPVFLVACGAYGADTGVGIFAGDGEIFIGSITETPKGAVKIYEEWRGKAFSPDDTATWPVSGTELGAAIAAFHTDATAKQK
jgi:hypothetical protein